MSVHHKKIVIVAKCNIKRKDLNRKVVVIVKRGGKYCCLARKSH